MSLQINPQPWRPRQLEGKGERAFWNLITIECAGGTVKYQDAYHALCDYPDQYERWKAYQNRLELPVEEIMKEARP